MLPDSYNTKVDGAAVRRRRKRLGLTQDLFARLLGVNSNTVLNWEKGRSAIAGETIRLMLCIDYVPDEMIDLGEWRNKLKRAAGNQSKAIRALFMLIRPNSIPVPQEN